MLKETTLKIGPVLAVFFILGIVGCTNRDTDLPSKLGDLKLNKVIRGQEAADIVHKMHRKRLGAVEYIIGYYGILFSKNILYTSLYENADAAKAALIGMAAKMSGGTKVFSPLETLGKMGDQVTFRTKGMGLVHYFYRDGRILLWWQVEPERAESTYKDLLQSKFTSLKRS